MSFYVLTGPQEVEQVGRRKDWSEARRRASVALSAFRYAQHKAPSFDADQSGTNLV